MKKVERDLITEFLVKTQNMTTETVATLFNENGEEHELKAEFLTTALQTDAARVTAFKAKEEAARVKGYDKAKAETLGKFETDVKTKFGIDSEKTGIELLEEIITTKVPAAAEGKLDADKLKVHPVWLAHEKELAKTYKAEVDAAKKLLDDYKAEVATEKTFSDVSKKGLEHFDAMKPILSKDANKAAKQRELVAQGLKAAGLSYQVGDDGEILILKDGKRHEDAYGKPISFETHVKEIASQYFDFEDGAHHSSPGADNKGKPGAQGQQTDPTAYKGPVPKNDDEYSKVFSTLKTAEERAGMNKAYKAQQQKEAQA